MFWKKAAHHILSALFQPISRVQMKRVAIKHNNRHHNNCCGCICMDPDDIGFLLLWWMSVAFLLLHCWLNVHACVASDRVCVRTSGGGQRSEFNASFRLRCVVCLCCINQLPYAGVKVWLRWKVANNMGGLRSKVPRLLNHRHQRHKGFGGLIWRARADVTAGTSPLTRGACLNRCSILPYLTATKAHA